jgi:uncharacterized repeat protein (TIGR03803 family)
MPASKTPCTFNGRISRPRVTTLAFVVLSIAFIAKAQAQTLTDIHGFTGSGDGNAPFAGLSMDRAGNLYGTASGGGTTGRGCPDGCGTVFKLKHSGTGWILTPLYTFQGGSDGFLPLARVTIGRDGNLYGTTTSGGTGCDLDGGCGTVFRLRPPATACSNTICPWSKTVLYRFTGSGDGAIPLYGDLAFDQAGNVYGTTSAGGAHGEGVVFKLTSTGQGWTESVLYSFAGGNDGAVPLSGVTFDQAGNLYGTTQYGGAADNGTVYELSPSGSGWVKTILSSLQNAGQQPFGGVAFDASGNLFGTTYLGGAQGSGTVYELQPANGGWTTTLLHSFGGDGGPTGSVFIDASGNLYGSSETTNGFGLVFELSPSNGGWTYTELHNFTGSDGFFPFGNVILDTNGNIFGTTNHGGANNSGAVWEITP